jgi:hypothetical protein
MRVTSSSSVFCLTIPRMRFAYFALAASITCGLPQVGRAQVGRAQVNRSQVNRSQGTDNPPTTDRAGGPSVEQCISASEAALESMNQELFIEARKHAAMCSHVGCPEVIRQECARLSEQWSSSQPRFTFRLVGSTGEDLAEGHVVLDGLAVEQWGSPVDVNPGHHTARFEAPGYVSQEQARVVSKGEGTRVWIATLQLLAAEGPREPATTATTATAASGSSRGEQSVDHDSLSETQSDDISDMQITGLAIAGAGVLGLATGGVFMLFAKGDYDESLKNGCDSRGLCTSDKGVALANGARDNANVATPFVIAGGALAVGGAALLVADLLWPGGGGADGSHVAFQPVVSLGGSGVSFSGDF